MKYRIPFIKPSFPSPESLSIDYKKIVESNWYTNFGSYEKDFSKGIEEFVGQKSCAATVSNATQGLIIAVQATLGMGDGSQFVLMPSFTFVAGAQALLWCGYKPYFIDINEVSLQMDIAASRRVLKVATRPVRAILFCNAFGVGASTIDLWEELADEYKLPLIIDSAAGFGSRYLDRAYLGARGSCEIFSFHATKPFAVGEGGAVISRDPELIKKVKSIQNFGFGADRDTHWLGTNAKLQEFNAAIGLRQLEDFPNRLHSRQTSFQSYRAALQKDFSFQENAEHSALCFASLICTTEKLRNNIIDHLDASGVEVKQYYSPPVHLHDYFLTNSARWTADRLKNTEEVCRRILSLPIHDNMLTEDINYIISLIQDVVSRNE